MQHISHLSLGPGTFSVTVSSSVAIHVFFRRRVLGYGKLIHGWILLPLPLLMLQPRLFPGPALIHTLNGTVLSCSPDTGITSNAGSLILEHFMKHPWYPLPHMVHMASYSSGSYLYLPWETTDGSISLPGVRAGIPKKLRTKTSCLAWKFRHGA